MSVQRILEAIIRDAERDADLVAALLDSYDLKAFPASQALVPTNGTPKGPAAEMLLGLAAAFRLRSWERAGISGYLPLKLPSSADALAAAVAAAENRGGETSIAIRRAVFQASFLYISRESQEMIAADVALPSNVNADELLERLADFLFVHRHLMDEQKDGTTDDT